LKKRVLVTGGAGFIGSHLVKRLVAEGAEVVVIDDLSMGDASKVDSGAQLIALDVRSLEASRLIKDFKPDVVFHLAAQINLRRSLQQPLEDASINILGSINVMQSLVESAEDISKVKFVFSSTESLSTNARGTPRTLPTSLMAARAAKVPNVAICATFSSPYCS